MNIKNQHHERQTATSLEGIRQDHIERYRVALKFICPEDRVLDAACGIGYGSYLIAKEIKPKHITALDRSGEAINHAKEFFYDRRISYLAKDIYELKDFPAESFDVICALETLEHLEKDAEFLEILHKLLTANGVLVISTPNQDVLPFKKEKFPFHARHYTSEEFIQLLEAHGFGIHTGYTQVNYQAWEGFGARFNIAICKKTLFSVPSEGVIKPYIEFLIKEIRPTSAFFREFAGTETRHLLQLGRESEASYLLDKWIQYDENNPEAWYMMGYYCEKNNNTYAQEAFQKAINLPVNEENKAFIVSALVHLANLRTSIPEKKECLKKCLALEPGHQKAKEILKKIES